MATEKYDSPHEAILAEFARKGLGDVRVEEEMWGKFLPKRRSFWVWLLRRSEASQNSRTVFIPRNDLSRILVEIEKIEHSLGEAELLIAGELRRRVGMTRPKGLVKLRRFELTTIVKRHRNLLKWERKHFPATEAPVPAR